MKKLIAVCEVLVIATVISTLAFGEYWDWNADRIIGDPTVTVVGDLAVTGSLTVSGSTVVDNGTTTSIAWDCVTSRPTINGTTVTGAVLDNASKYPTFNQTTTGTAAGLTNQYINWNSSSGGASVSNRPTINGVTVTGAVLDNASNYPTLNQSTSGNAANVTGTVAVANGGTGSDNATGARTNLGLDNADNYPTLDQDTMGTASNITGVLSKALGGHGEDVSAATGFPYWSSGSLIWKTIVTLLAMAGVTYNPADNTWTFPAEIVASQISTTATDNQFFVQVANSGTPSIPASDNAGMIWFNTTDNTIKVTNSAGAVGSITVTW